jgi:hypothetical protein
MILTQSPDYELEHAVLSLINDSTDINCYGTNRIGARLFPYVVISAQPVRQLITPYSGVYEMQVSVDYSDSSALVGKDAFDAEYLNIFSHLYDNSTTLVAQIESHSVNLKTYMARISSQTPTIQIAKRAWQRGLVIMAICTPSTTSPTSLRSLDFSDYLNSQYLGLI